MNTFINKVNLSFEAFYAQDYAASCNILKEAYLLLLKENNMLPSPYYMEKALTIVEEFIQLPEIEKTDFLVNTISSERALLLNQEGNIFKNRFASVVELVELLQDFETIINYWDEYLGGLNNTDKPSITVGIESKGQFSFFENIYQDQTLGMMK